MEQTPKSIEQPAILPADSDLDLIRDFLTESRELADAAEKGLLLLEHNPDDEEPVNAVFRAFHTIKGTSGFLGFDRITELAHKAESLLVRVRDHEIRYSGNHADLALRSIDMMKELLDAVDGALAGRPMKAPRDFANLIQALGAPESETPASAESPATHPLMELPPPAAPAKPSESTIRVSTARLDGLIDMVGELVIAQSMLAQDETALHAADQFSRKVTHLGKIVRELQELSLSMRMVPLKGTFQKMARVARDVSNKNGKWIELVTEDRDTEIDRNMVDIINDILVHMVRNSADHGIESPEERERTGKPMSGRITLTAYHTGDNVAIEVRDDGKGLDAGKIAAKAVARGLLSPGAHPAETELFNLIFQPGFSTAPQVTDVSGRGVGMDIVKKGVESLRGQIEVASTQGDGCCFTIRLPLTLAITDGMIVRVGEERYVIPTASIHVSFRPAPEALFTLAGRGELVMLRNETMPLFRLHRLLGIADAIEDPTRALVVVVSDQDRRAAILVDDLLGQQQVVAKPLGSRLGKIPGVSGGAILGDGRVGLILDPAEIIGFARRKAS